MEKKGTILRSPLPGRLGLLGEIRGRPRISVVNWHGMAKSSGPCVNPNDMATSS